LSARPRPRRPRRSETPHRRARSSATSCASRARATHVAAIKAAANAVAQQINASCPKVLAKAPKTGSKLQQLAALEFELDLAAQIYVAAVKPIAPIGEQAALAQERLRFSDQSLEWSVHLTAAGTGYVLSLQPPNLCTQARGFATSGYTAPPAASGRLFTHVIANDAVGSPEALIRRMRPYAPAAVATGLKRLAALNHRLNRKLSLDGAANRLYEAVYGRPAAQGGLARRLPPGL
jgi:hypothetical protein